MRDLVAPLADLLLGARCAGCHGPALLLCRACGEKMRPEPIEGGAAVPSTPIAAGLNDGVMRRVLIAWKEGGATRLTGVLSHHLATAVAPHLRPGQQLTLVAVPTSRHGRRRRGGDLVEDLARSAARLLRRTGADVDVAAVLGFARATRDQAGLDARDRQTNVAGAFRARSNAVAAGRDIVVVDDISTTGATLAEAVRALVEAGHRPIGSAVVAATPRHSKGPR